MAKQTRDSKAAPKRPDPRHATDADPVHEDLCTRCGKCCYKKIIVGRTVVITPFPCEFLDTETNTCTVYEERFEKNPECLTVEQGMAYSAFPSDCPYVEKQAPAGYRPALDTWSWRGKWGEFDEWAEDLGVEQDAREKVRARGPHAPPMWVEANARIAKERETRGEPPLFWGQERRVVSMTPSEPAPDGVPLLAMLLRKIGL